MKRPGVTVAARKGYFAAPRHRRRHRSTRGRRRRSARSSGSRCRTPFRCARPRCCFPSAIVPGLVPVVVDLKTAPLTFQPAADGKTYSSDFAMLVRFLDQQNQVVRKVSQHYEVNGPIGDIERAKQGEVLFYREPELPPGVYTMETVVYDAPSGKSSVRFSTVEVPQSRAGALRMSSLVLVKRGEKVADKDRRADNPLLVKDVVLYPNLGEPVSKAAKELGFYFTVYPAAGAPAPAAAIQLLLNGKLVAQVPDDAAGRRRVRPHPAARPPAARSARARTPTSCARWSSRATASVFAFGPASASPTEEAGESMTKAHAAGCHLARWSRRCRLVGLAGQAASAQAQSAAVLHVDRHRDPRGRRRARSGTGARSPTSPRRISTSPRTASARKSTPSRRVSHGGGIGVGVAWQSPSRATDGDVIRERGAEADRRRRRSLDDATTALVFDHLSSETLRLAQKATLDYVPLSGESSVRVGVFATDPGMRVVQGYTTDRTLVRQAVARVQPSGMSRRGAEGRPLGRVDRAPARSWRRVGRGRVRRRHAAAGAALARNASELGERENELQLIQTELNMLRSFDNLDRVDQGLRHVAVAARGRASRWRTSRAARPSSFSPKGCRSRRRCRRRLDSVIDAANRANVTAYAVDAKGLRAKSTLDERRGRRWTSFAEDRLNRSRDRPRSHRSAADDGDSSGSKTRSSSTRAPGLARLAEDTGGFLVEQIERSRRRRSAASTRTTSSTTCSPIRRRTTVPTASSARSRSRSTGPARRSSRARAIARIARRPRPIDAGGYERRRWRCSIARRCRTRFRPCRRLQLPGSRAPRPDAGPRARRHRVAAIRSSIASDPRIPAGWRWSCGCATARGTRSPEAQPAVRADGRGARISRPRSAARSSSIASPICRPASTRWRRSSSTRSRARAASASRR